MLRLDGTSWTASYGLFDWVVDALAERVRDPQAVQTLREISRHSLGSLDVADLGAGEQEAREVLRRMGDIAERDLPPSPHRDEVVAHVRRLSVAAGAPDTTPGAADGGNGT